MAFTFNKKTNGVKNRLIATIQKKGEETDVYLNIEPSTIKEGHITSIVGNGDKIIPIIDKSLRSVIYVAGASGSGKSYFVAKWIHNALQFYKGEEVFLFSPIKNDPSLNTLKYTAIELNQDIKDMSVDDFKDSFVIFDDCDTIRDRHVAALVSGLRDELLETGRHTSTKMVITSHLISNFKETRRVLNEATAIVIYPNSSGTYSIKQYLKTYLGLNKAQIERILKVKDRWCLISKSYPIYILTESEIFIP